MASTPLLSRKQSVKAPDDTASFKVKLCGSHATPTRGGSEEMETYEATGMAEVALADEEHRRAGTLG